MNITATITVDAATWRDHYPQEDDGGILGNICSAIRSALTTNGTPTATLVRITNNQGVTIRYTPDREVEA